MPKLSRDLAIPSGGVATLNPRETIFLSGNLAAANAEVVIPCDGCSNVAVVITGTFSLTTVVEGSIDGVNWDTVPLKQVALGGAWAINVGSPGGRWSGPIGPFKVVRARCSGYTSGAANVVIIAENGVSDVVSQTKATDLAVTNTLASGAAVTLTLPAAGAQLFHFITRIQIDRIAAAVLTAAATPVLVTTTNLPGSRVFSIPADAALLGTKYPEILEPPAPIRSSASNTATTIVAPGTTGVIWRITADYFNALHG